MSVWVQHLEELVEKTKPSKEILFKKEDEESTDKFIVLRRSIHDQLEEIREDLHKRSQMEQDPEKAALSAKIRQKIKRVKKDFAILGQIKSKKKQKQVRNQVKDLIREHIQECEKLERGFDVDVEANYDPRGTQIHSFNIPEGLLMNANEAEINRLLGILEPKVLESKDIALSIGEEAERTAIKLETINNKADDVNETLITYNEHLLDILKKKNPCCRFLLEIIIVIIVLATIGLIVNQYVN